MVIVDSLFPASIGRSVKPRPLLIPYCEQCGLYKNGCRTPKMNPDGLGERGILIVSDHPGSAEDINGIPMSDKTGQWLSDRLRDVGVQMRRDCTITNALICKPGEIPKTAVEDCRPNLIRTIERVKPRCILLMGHMAVHSLVGHLWREELGPIDRWMGWKIPAHNPNAWIVPMGNPAYMSRPNADRMERDQFLTDLAAAVALRGQPHPNGPPAYDRAVETIHDPNAAAQILSQMTSGTIAYDYETDRNTPDHRNAFLVCAAVCHNGTRTIAFPWMGAAIYAMRKLMANPDVGKIAHNIMMEDRWSRKHLGIEVNGWIRDTMVLAQMLVPRRNISGLKFQVFVRLGVPQYNYHIEQYLRAESGNAPNRVREIDREQLLKYCGMDALLTYLLSELQTADLR